MNVLVILAWHLGNILGTAQGVCGDVDPQWVEDISRPTVERLEEWVPNWTHNPDAETALVWLTYEEEYNNGKKNSFGFECTPEFKNAVEQALQ
jgi:hypothetical protein